MSLQISVVIPTYKRPALLRTCLISLSRQSLDKKSYEVIIVSDGPDKDAKKITKVFESIMNIHYSSLKRKLGPAAARNKGWRMTKTNIIAFTDDDTIQDKNWLKEALKEFKKDTQVLCGRIIVPLSKKPTHYEKITSLLQGAEFVTANCFCTKKALRKVGGFDERFNIAWREDSDLQFKFLNNGYMIKKSLEAIVIHPVRKDHWWTVLKQEKKNMYDPLLFKKHPNLFIEKIPRYILIETIYITIVSSFIILFINIFLRNYQAILYYFFVWITLIFILIILRVKNSSYSFINILQIIITSLFIPFLSIFWKVYGAIKYHALYI